LIFVEIEGRQNHASLCKIMFLSLKVSILSTFKCEGCGVRKPEVERYRPRSAFTVCSQSCLDTAAQKKAQAVHHPCRRDLLAMD
jgi:hypothetical protein